MSVLIKGMEMPENCSDCEWSYYVGNGRAMCRRVSKTDKTDIMTKRRADFCPLTEINTPHGELVDRNGLMDIYADRLTAVAERYSPDSSECGILSGAMKLLAIQPTVIEAEGREE